MWSQKKRSISLKHRQTSVYVLYEELWGAVMNVTHSPLEILQQTGTFQFRLHVRQLNLPHLERQWISLLVNIFSLRALRLLHTPLVS